MAKTSNGDETCELYLMRHGPAGQRGSLGPAADDGLRPLTPQGRDKVEKAAAGLRKLAADVEWIVTSPLVRARETAEIVAEHFPGVPIDPCAALADGKAEEVVAFLARKSGRKRVLLVGHEPHLGQMAGRLLGLGARANLSLKKGGCCLITLAEFPPEGPGELVWWATPRMLRKLG